MIAFLEGCFWVYIISIVVLLMSIAMLDIDDEGRFFVSFKVYSQDAWLSFVPVYNTYVVLMVCYIFSSNLWDRWFK